MLLFINTKNAKLVEVALKEGSQVVGLTEENVSGSQALLPLIQTLLASKRLTFGDLDGIEVATGPGSFTGLRVGVAVANTLAFALGIPVNGKRMETDLNYD